MEYEDSSIYYIKKQFLCCTPLRKFDFATFEENEFETVDVCTQEKILDSTVNNQIVKKYPLKKSYQKSFLKLLIDKLEKNNDEVHSDLYDEYCNFISLNDEESSTHYRHFLLENNLCITLEESTSIVSQGTTGLCTWQAASSLAEWCISNKSKLSNKRILELGSGIGLTGLAVINTCFPKQYTFSDCHPAVLNLLCKNLLRNLSKNLEQIDKSDERLQFNTRCKDTEVRAVDLKWEEMNKYLNENIQVPEIVIAADVLYDNSNFYVLSNALETLLMKGSHYIIIAATVRNSDTVDQFLDQLEDKKLSYSNELLPKSTIFIPTDDIPIRIIKVFK